MKLKWKYSCLAFNTEATTMNSNLIAKNSPDVAMQCTASRADCSPESVSPDCNSIISKKQEKQIVKDIFLYQ